MAVTVRVPDQDRNGNEVFVFNVEGRGFTVQDGVLVVLDEETDGRSIAVYAPGSWLYAYVEPPDED